VRLVAVALLASLAAGGLGACGDRVDDRDRLLASLRRTRALALTFSYREDAAGQRLGVDGVVEDDFRYAGRLSLDGVPLYEQVVADDLLGFRMLATDKLPATSLTPAPEGDAAIRSSSWVVDPVGAPPLSTAKKRTGPIGGRDLLAEAYTYLLQVEADVTEAAAVRKYSDEALYYKPSEDPFPTPKDDSGVTRYDLERPRLPRASQASGGAGGAASRLPGARHFRKLSIYVKDGLVQRVLERVAFDERLDDTLDYFDSLTDETADGSAAASGLGDFLKTARSELKAGRRTSVEQATLAGLNTSRATYGEDPIEFRNVEVLFRDFGGDTKVEIPDGAVETSLSTLFKVVDTEEGADATSGASTTTSSPPTTTAAPSP
jgi:hypothetical protein